MLISPLRRTLQTAYYLLKDHPNKEKINYVIHPGVREHLVGVSEMTDKWEEKLVNEYQHYFPNLDTSLMKTKSGTFNELFYLRDIQPELKAQFKGKTKQEIEQLVRASSDERFPRSGEHVEGTYDRVQKVTPVTYYLGKINILKNISKEDFRRTNTRRYWLSPTPYYSKYG